MSNRFDLAQYTASLSRWGWHETEDGSWALNRSTGERGNLRLVIGSDGSWEAFNVLLPLAPVQSGPSLRSFREYVAAVSRDNT